VPPLAEQGSDLLWRKLQRIEQRGHDDQRKQKGDMLL
jgi:hypothetical protein